MSEFRFADPQWVHALWGVLAFVALLLWLDVRSVTIRRLICPMACVASRRPADVPPSAMRPAARLIIICATPNAR